MLTLGHFTKVHHHDTYPAIDETQPAHSCAGKSVFVTGGGTGIGQAIAIAFGRASANAVFLGGRTKSTLEDTKAQVRRVAPDCIVETYVMDVVNEEQVSKAFAEAVERIGKSIDILINNAGYVAWMETAASSSFDKLWTHFEINVKGSMLVTMAFLKNAPQKGATLINVSSGAAVINYTNGLSAYSASKVATVKMFDYIHREEIERELRIFNIQPGIVPTAMASEGKQEFQSDTPELPGSYVVWLSSADADFLKGRFMYANWDIDELKARKEEIVSQNLLTLTLKGLDSTEWRA